MENSLISIIIPIYNSENTLSRIVDCVLKQDYRNWELLLVDDGSLDNSFNLCKEYATKDKRVVCYHQDNHGVSSARNVGVSKANGEYIVFLDSDDYIDSNYLSELVRCCWNNDLGICDVLVEKNNEIINRFSLVSQSMDKTKAIDYLLSRKSIHSGPVAKIYRTNIIKNIEFPEHRYYEDLIFNLKVFQVCNHIGVTHFTSYHYLDNQNGAMSKVMNKGLFDLLSATDDILKYLSSNEQDPQCTYVTISHLMQYIYPAFDVKNEYTCKFVKASKKLIKKYRKNILRCSAFPVKEKIIYIAFTLGFLYKDRNIRKV